MRPISFIPAALLLLSVTLLTTAHPSPDADDDSLPSAKQRTTAHPSPAADDDGTSPPPTLSKSPKHTKPSIEVSPSKRTKPSKKTSSSKRDKTTYYSEVELHPDSLGKPCSVPRALQCDHGQAEQGDMALYYYCHPQKKVWVRGKCGSWTICVKTKSRKGRHCRFRLSLSALKS